MTTAAATRTRTVATHRWAPFGLLPELAHPGQVFAHLTPNWYASVMGTGVVAVAAASLPVQIPGLRALATGMWLLAAALLVALSVATALHWHRHAGVARTHLVDPVMGHFYGAPPMAVLTVGAGTMLLGPDLLGARASFLMAAALWTVGTVAGLVGAVVVPYLMITRHRPSVRAAFGGWLMSVVPPMVSASTGALLLPHLESVTARAGLLVACYAMFGVSLLASVVVVALLCRRLLVHPAGPARMVPTLCIVLGPLGQSITAVNLLGGVAPLAVSAPEAVALQGFGVRYGTLVLMVALAWALGAGVTIIRTARRDGLPFSLTWWSFTFPVGTCVTGASALARHTGSTVFAGVAVVLFGLLIVAWLTVAALTARGSLRGGLFLPPLRPAVG